MNRFIEAIKKKKVLLLDGAMGTELIKRLGRAPEFPELLNVEAPSVIEDIHRAYVEAGADIIETNSFGGSPIKLAQQQAEARTEELNERAVALAHRAAQGRPVFIAGSMGPCGSLIDPLGPVSVQQVFDSYARQATALERAGADLLMIETQIDILEARTAVLASKQATNLPVALSMTYPMEGEPVPTTVTGSTPEAAVVALDGLDLDLIGVNCGLHPEGFVAIIQSILANTDRPVIAYANAGLPVQHSGVLEYPLGPEAFASYAISFQEMGASVVGGCCGTTPDHIRRIAQTIKGRAVVQRNDSSKQAFCLASRTKVLRAGAGPFAVIGETINPFGRKSLARQLKESRLDLVRDLARSQEQAGAHALDVNLGRSGDRSPDLFAEAITQIQSVSNLPLLLDTSSVEAAEAALRVHAGKAAINSVSGQSADHRRDHTSPTQILELAARYGAGVVLLAMDDDGIPDQAAGRMAILMRLYERALDVGLRPTDIVADPVVLAASAATGSVQTTLETIALLSKRGIATICGLSNVSFGLPGRSTLNAAFLSMAMAHGLSSAIINPADPRMVDARVAAEALTGRDRGMRAFVDLFSTKKAEAMPDEVALRGLDETAPPDEVLHQAVVLGERDAAGRATRLLLDQGRTGLSLVEGIIAPALEDVGRAYEQKVYFLPQLVMSAEAARAASAVIEEAMTIKADGTQDNDGDQGGESQPSHAKARVVIATIQGDIHDIGKNIVALILRNYGHDVIDLGKNVTADQVVTVAVDRQADIIALSALMTTTMDGMRDVIEVRNERAPRVKVLIGGAAVNKAFCKEIGADAYGRDAMEAVHLIADLVTHDNGEPT